MYKEISIDSVQLQNLLPLIENHGAVSDIYPATEAAHKHV